MWNANVQHDSRRTVVTVGYAGSRGRHLLRSNDVNVATPQIRPDGTPFFPAGAPRTNPAFTTIELKSSDGDSWYRALILEARTEWGAGLTLQSSYTWSRAEDTTQASTFFSDSTNGTTTAFPEFIPDYNKGLSDFHIAHNWVLNFTWRIPFAADRTGVAAAVFKGWQVSGIGHAPERQPADSVRAGQSIAIAVAAVAGAWCGAGSSELRAGLRS